jgi:hypothetical protein
MPVKQGARRHPNWPARNQTTRVGHVQLACWRALVAAGGVPLPTSALLAWAPGVLRSNLRKSARRFAERIDGGRREAVWRLRDG